MLNVGFFSTTIYIRYIILHSLHVHVFLHFTQVLRTQQLMRVLKTMNTVGEIKRDSFVGLSNIGESTQHQRRGAKTLEKVGIQ